MVTEMVRVDESVHMKPVYYVVYLSSYETIVRMLEHVPIHIKKYK